MFSWDLDQLLLTGIGIQRLYLLVSYWLICLREQTIAYATAQIAEIFHQSFMYPTTWNIWNIWTMNALNISTLQAFQHFPRTQNSVCQKNLPTTERAHCQPAARKLVRSKKRSPDKVQRRNSRTVSKKNNFEATKRSNFVAKRTIDQKNNFPFRHYSFLLRWNSLFQ